MTVTYNPLTDLADVFEQLRALDAEKPLMAPRPRYHWGLAVLATIRVGELLVYQESGYHPHPRGFARRRDEFRAIRDRLEEDARRAVVAGPPA